MSGFQIAAQRTIPLQRAGIVRVFVNALQSFDLIPSAFRWRLYINDELIYAPGGTYPGDIIFFSGRKFCPAGTVTARVEWAAATTVRLVHCEIDIDGLPNSVGV